MSDDFETVNLRRAARDIEILRDHYREHRETLQQLASAAPTEYLAAEYGRLISAIDVSLSKLDELDANTTIDMPPPPPPLQRPRTSPGAPMASLPGAHVSSSPSTGRVLMIVGAGLLALAIIGWLIWRASSNRTTPTVADASTTTVPIVEDPGTVAPVTPAPAATAALRVTPATIDYGIIRKGTRATRQFDIANTGDEPVDVQVARSKCRCLYYEYSEKIAAKGREGLTVTVDGAKAKDGTLLETIQVTSKKDPAVATTFELTATIE